MAYARINCIPPEELPRKVLLAEMCELPRIIKLVRSAVARGETFDHPANKDANKAGFKAFGQGTGHLRFFYTRCQYLFNRQTAIIAEAKKRGIVNLPKAPNGLLTGIPQEFYNDWKPSYDDMKANREHIQTLTEKRAWHS